MGRPFSSPHISADYSRVYRERRKRYMEIANIRNAPDAQRKPFKEGKNALTKLFPSGEIGGKQNSKEKGEKNKVSLVRLWL